MIPRVEPEGMPFRKPVSTPDQEPTARPGLFFLGYGHSLRGHLFEANRASRRLAENVAEYLSRPALARASE